VDVGSARSRQSFKALAKVNHHHFIPTSQTRVMLPLLPLPDGTRTCWIRWEECLSGTAVTCGSSRKEAVTIVAPLAAGLSAGRNRPSQPPGRDRIQGRASRRGRLCLWQDQGCGAGTGLWRAFGLLDLKHVPDHENHLPWPVQAAAGAIRGGDKRPQSTRCRLSDADIIRRISGRARAAPPFLPSSRGKARVRPSGLAFPNPGDFFARGVLVWRQ